VPNDSDPDGDPLTVTDVLMDTDGGGLADDPVAVGTTETVYGTDLDGNVVEAGTLVVNADGSYTFTPNATFTGDVPAAYTVSDGALTDDATLTITVVPDVGNETFANDDANSGPEDVIQTGNILANDSDPEGEDQDVSLIDTDGDGAPDTAPVAGTPIDIYQDGTKIGTLTVDPETGEYIWDPEPGFIGTAVVPYEVCDDGTPQACDEATLYLTTLAFNDTDAQNDINQTPVNVPVSGDVSTNDSDAQGDNQTVTSALADTDGDGLVDDVLTIGTATTVYGTNESGTVVVAGTLTLNADGTYDYVPAADFEGTVPAEYTVTDDNANPETDSATLTIDVFGDIFGLNDPPVAQDDTNKTEVGVAVSANAIVPNDSDPDGDPLAVTAVVMDTDGDGLADDPVAVGTTETVYGTDEDGTVVEAGTLVVNADGSYTFTPNATFTGDVPAEYTIEDPGGLSDDATLTITVVPDAGNDTFANDDANSGPLDTVQTGNILDNDSDPEGDDQDVSLIDTNGDGVPDTAPVAGTPIDIYQDGTKIGELTVYPQTGFYIWDPEPDFSGTAVVPYTATDGTTSDDATLYLTTLATNDQPDITPIITAVPNVMTGVTAFNVTVRVVELNGVDTSGLITLRIPKDLRWVLAEPYDPGLTILGAIEVDNLDWSFTETGAEYIFTTTVVIPAYGDSTFGIKGTWDAGQTQGQYTITTQIDSGSGNEDRYDNNGDAEKLDYFIN
jgi:hypothetical protein